MSDTPPTRRLVIRIKLPPREAALQTAARRSLSKRALLLIVGAVVVVALLSVIGISVFSSKPAPAPRAVAPVVRVAPAVRTEAPPTPAVESQPAPPAPLKEVLPEIPRSALATIRGTIKIFIRVVVDQDGKVLSATTAVPGPSRYFERLALAAAKQWTFAPAATEQRVMLVRFNLTRDGVTGTARETQ